MQSFFFRQYATYDQEYGSKDWLYINNFGYYRNISKNICTNRSVPRADYHLLYVSSGEVSVNGTTLKSGDSYLFMPHERHSYTYKKTDNSLYYWIHFTGSKVPEVLLHNEISKGVNENNQRKQQKDEIFAMMSAELSKCTDEASSFAVSLFFSFLSLLKKEQGRKHFYTRALRELENMNVNTSVCAIAESYDICTAHFIRSFKAIYGMTPNEYRQNYRISYAMNLLKMTNLSVQDIARQCGFGDSFYFSRLFKKSVGVSPSQYRKHVP